MYTATSPSKKRVRIAQDFITPCRPRQGTQPWHRCEETERVGKKTAEKMNRPPVSKCYASVDLETPVVVVGGVECENVLYQRVVHHHKPLTSRETRAFSGQKAVITPFRHHPRTLHRLLLLHLLFFSCHVYNIRDASSSPDDTPGTNPCIRRTVSP